MKLLVVGDFQGKFPARLKRRIAKEEFDLVVGVGDYAGIDDWKPYIMDVFRRIKNKEERISPEDYFGKKGHKELWEKDFKAGRMVFREIDKIKKPTISVFGNSDDKWYNYPFDGIRDSRQEKRRGKILKSLKNFIDINYKKKKLFGFNWIGFGGYMDIESFVKDKEFRRAGKKKLKATIKRMRKSKEKLFKLFDGLKGRKENKILVLHYPPQGVFDIIKDKRNPINGRGAGVKSFSLAIKKYKPILVLCGHMHEYQGLKYLHGVPVINPGDAGEGKFAIVEVPSEKGKSVKARFIK